MRESGTEDHVFQKMGRRFAWWPANATTTLGCSPRSCKSMVSSDADFSKRFAARFGHCVENNLQSSDWRSKGIRMTFGNHLRFQLFRRCSKKARRYEYSIRQP